MKNCVLVAAGACVFAGTANAELVGLWEFENAGNLGAATIGSDLTLTGSASSVAGSSTPSDTGATQVGVGSYYTMTHGIAGNGGGTLVNEWSLVMDVSYPQSSAGEWRALFQTNEANDNDGDAFFRAGADDNPNADTIGVSATGYTTQQTSADTWYRIVFSVDNGSFFRIYVDGVQQLEAAVGDVPGLDGRFGLDPTLLILADNDGEDNTLNLSNLAIFDTALSTSDAASLGGAGRAITNVPEPTSLALLGLGSLLVARRRRNG